MSAGNGNFMVKFDVEVDRGKVVASGPQMFQNHYLAIKHWTPFFNPSNDCFGRTMVWMRFEGLNMMYYEDSAIKTIVTGIGKPIRVGFATRKRGGGSFQGYVWKWIYLS